MKPKTKKNNDVLVTIEPRLISADVAARILGISVKYFWQLDRAGRVPLPVQNFGGRRKLWSVAELDEFVQKGCKPR